MSEDTVVRELDVYLCNGRMGDKTQVYLMQYPLRPPWRRYDTDETTKMRFKPDAKLFEVEIPLDTRGSNYNREAEESMKVKHITLRSTRTELASTYAIGSVRGNKLLLMPVDEAVQLRPTLSHLDAVRTESNKAEDSPDDAQEGKFIPLQVTIQRRETERQQQMRLNSYAYLKKQEDEEKWQDIMVHPADSAAADHMWKKLSDVPDDTPLLFELSPQDYLAALIPSSTAAVVMPPDPFADPAPSGQDMLGKTSQRAGMPAVHAVKEERANGKEARQLGQPEPMQGVEVQGEPLDVDTLAKLTQAMQALFRNYAVVTLTNIRSWLVGAKQANAPRSCATWPDVKLHQAVLQVRHIRHMKRVYVSAASSSSNSAVDDFRGVVLDLLAKKDSLKKTEVMSAAKAAGLTVSDAMYQKAMKEICNSRGALWTLKSGVDGRVC